MSDPPKSPPRGSKGPSRNCTNVNKDKIISEATQHKNFSFDSATVTELPQFNDISRYGVEQDDSQRLLEKEVDRLKHAATTTECELFDSKELLGRIEASSFKDLNNVTFQIFSNISTTLLDNGVMILENCPKSGLLELGLDLIKDNYSKQKHRSTAMAKKSLPTPSAPESKRIRELYFAVVDYVTSCLSRLLIRTITNEFWIPKTFAALALLTVKLKFLSRDFTLYAMKAVSDAEDAVKRHQEDEDIPWEMRVTLRSGEGGRSTEKEVMVGEEHSIDELYYATNLGIHDILSKIVWNMVGSMVSKPSFGHGYDDIQYCTFIYETGLSQSLAVVTDDNSGGVTTTSSLINVRTCSQALELVQIVFRELKRVKAPPQSTSPLSNQAVFTLAFARTSDGNNQQEVFAGETNCTSKMDDWVSLVVPMSLSDPCTADAVEDLVQIVYNVSGEDELIKRVQCPRIKAKCTMQTQTFQERQMRLLEEDQYTIPIIGSKLEQRLRAGTNVLSAWDIHDRAAPGNFAKGLGRDVLELYQESSHKMRTWVFTATSVTVRCRGYILGVLSLCLAIVLGGLAVPFTVTDRIAGVDPFNITMFVWLIVGTILVAAKGRYVKEWPWNDFIHGRVVCTSVSDLAEVSGIDKQLVLLKLLNDEQAIKLITDGPYNGMFSQKAEVGSRAFSIDEPVKLSTMITAGFIILKVLSEHGEHLVCLDSRRNSSVGYASSTSEGLRYLSCQNLINPDDGHNITTVGKNIEGMKEILYLKREKLGWKRVLGLYIAKVAFG